MLFGRPGGPARMFLALVAVGVLGLLSFVIFDLNRSLDNQHQANVTSIGVSQSFLDVSDQLTVNLGELDELTDTAQTALDSTRALGPLLTKLHDVIKPAAATLSSTGQAAHVTTDQLATIAQILGEVHNVILPLVNSAQMFGEQGRALLTVLEGVVADLRTAVQSASTINQMLPLPG